MAIVLGGPGEDVAEGTGSADIIATFDGNDVVIAKGGNDIITAGDGDDIIDAGAGADLIDAGDGNDIIAAGSGADVIVGGAGDDWMSGGTGHDIYRYSGDAATDIGQDIITDFNPAQDKIDLIGLTGVTSLADLKFQQVGDGVVITSEKFAGSIMVLGVTEADLKENNAIAVACFLRGTRVSTPDGEKAVEDLAIGDLVLTKDAGAVPVRWIGRRSYASRFLGQSKRILPIRIRAGALGDNLPVRDLYVSPEHAMFFDGVFVDARVLVNGTTITQERGPETIEYFHLDLGSHAVIYAEGAATESYVNHGNRGMFQNAHEYAELYGVDEVAPALPQGGGRERVYPAVYSGPRLQAIRDRVAAAAAAPVEQRQAA